MTSLAKALLPSSRAAAADGPKQAIPASRTASAAPATSGASGPTTTRSTPSATASAATAAGSVTSSPRCSATAAVPGLPGAHTSDVTAGVGRQRQAQRVLAPAAPDHEHPHDRNPPILRSVASA